MRERRALIVFLLLSVHLINALPARGVQLVHCTGRVVDVRGRPLAGVKVAAYEMVSDGVAGNIELHTVGEVITQDDGAFDFETEPRLRRGIFLDGYIVATKQGLALGWAVWNMRENAEAMIGLGQPEELEGVIVDGAGEPIAGAEVRANLYRIKKTTEGEEKREWLPGVAPIDCMGTKTDHQGRFRFDNIPPGSGVDLLITAARRATTYTYDWGGAPRFRDGAGSCFQAGQTDIKVVLPAEGRIEGRIVDRTTGRAVEGIKLAVVATFSPAFYYRFVTESDDNGVFRTGALQTGKYLIRGDFPALQVDVESGKIADEVVIECPGVVHGRVKGPDGKPIARATIQIREKREPGQRSIATPDVVTDEKGYYCYTGIEWPYRVSALWEESMPTGKGYRYQFLRRNQVFEGSQIVDFRFDNAFPIGTAVLDVQVTDQHGKTFKDFTANFSKNCDWNDYSGESLYYYGYVLQFSTADGRFKVSNLPAGSYGFKIYNQEKGQTYEFPYCEITLEQRKTTSILHKVFKKPIYYGRILFDDGTAPVLDPTPWPGAKVFVDLPDGDGEVDDQGYFTACLTDEELQRWKDKKEKPGIYCPIYDEKDTSVQVARFPVELLSQNKSEAGVVKIRKPIYRPEVELLTAPSLENKPLPVFDGIKINFSIEQVMDKMILVCFWDINQRPSRHCIRELANQAEQLKRKGVTIVAVQVPKVDEKELADSVKKYRIPFPVGVIEGDAERIRFAWGVRSLPWLTLTDRNHVVIAEGFGLSELNENIKETHDVER